MACECQYFFLALVESRREEFISHISPPHCPGSRDGWLLFSMVSAACRAPREVVGHCVCHHRGVQ